MRKKGNLIFVIVLIVYVSSLFLLAVVIREPTVRREVRLDLFWGYSHPGCNGYRDLLLNVATFSPIGGLIGLICKKNKIGKAMLVGLLISLLIEFSQLIWKKGIFDVDDLVNNVVGALIGGGIVAFVLYMRKRVSPLSKES